MAGDLFKSLMVHTCTVERIAAEPLDSIGYPTPVWAVEGTINCRFIEKQEKRAVPGGGFVMVETILMLMDSAEDVLVEDRITDVVWRDDGTVVNAGPFTIEAVLPRNTFVPHHKSLHLERVDKS